MLYLRFCVRAPEDGGGRKEDGPSGKPSRTGAQAGVEIREARSQEDRVQRAYAEAQVSCRSFA